jgi:hypothetical protein
VNTSSVPGPQGNKSEFDPVEISSREFDKPNGSARSLDPSSIPLSATVLCLARRG